jgi:hypothetical protein
MVVALDVEGRPICSEKWPGNTADAKTLFAGRKADAATLRLREISVVADRGMVNKPTSEALEQSDPPVALYRRGMDATAKGG